MTDFEMYEGVMPVEELLLLFGIVLLLYAFSMIWSVVSYVLQSMGLYSIAKRRELRHPWMAWVPLLSLHLLGSISDHYQTAVNRTNTKRRTVLLVAGIVYTILMLVFFYTYFVFFVQIIVFFGLNTHVTNSELHELIQYHLMGPAMGMLCAGLLMALTGLLVVVFRYIALYDVYASCRPDSRVGFLILSVFVSMAIPILVFICRDRDDGMKQPDYTMYPGWTPPQSPRVPAETTPHPTAPEEKEPWET